MSQGITDLDRLPAHVLAMLHIRATSMRDMVAANLNRSGPLFTRIDSLVDDIENAKGFGVPAIDDQNLREHTEAGRELTGYERRYHGMES